MLHVLFFLVSSLLIISSECFGQTNWHGSSSVSISEAYDDNIFSNESAVEDYITRTGADISVLYNGTNMGFRGDYHAEYSAYARHSKANVVSHEMGINANLNRWYGKLLKGGQLIIREDFTYTPDLREYYFSYKRDDIDPLSNYGIRTKRSDTYMNAASINSTIPLTNRFNMSLSYSSLLTEYKAPELWDNVSNTVGLGGKYLLPRDVIYTDITVSWMRVGFSDSISYSLSPGIRHSFSESLIFDINAGVVEFEPEEGDGQITSRGNIRLTKRSRWYTLDGGYTRSLNTVIGISNAPAIADLFYFNMTNIHSLNVTSNIGANYTINRSIDRTLSEMEEVDTASYNISGGVSYIINKWLRCSFTVSHFKQESDRPTVPDIRRDQAILTFRGTFD